MIVLCSPSSFQGEYLSGFAGYQGIENYEFDSLEVFDISCGAPAPGYSLSGDVPPGLICATPSSTSTKLISPKLGSLFSERPLKKVIEEYEVKPMTFSIAGSDQGSMFIVPEKTGSVITKTFNFTLNYNGVSSGSPCVSSLGLTLILMIDYKAQMETLDQLIEDTKNG